MWTEASSRLGQQQPRKLHRPRGNLLLLRTEEGSELAFILQDPLACGEKSYDN